ncbi:MAG: hypothetical protein U1F71_08835 [Verrucomicrobiaceae bacterium]
MKFIITLICFMLVTPVVNAGWFDDSEQKLRLQETEQQLNVQRQTTENWRLVSFSLGIGCVLLFTIGTAIGAKARYDARTQQPAK